MSFKETEETEGEFFKRRYYEVRECFYIVSDELDRTILNHKRQYSFLISIIVLLILTLTVSMF